MSSPTPDEFRYKYVVDFETEHILVLAPAELDDTKLIELTAAEYNRFKTIEIEYWSWQRAFRAQHHAAVRRRLEGNTTP